MINLTGDRFITVTEKESEYIDAALKECGIVSYSKIRNFTLGRPYMIVWISKMQPFDFEKLQDTVRRLCNI
jgi:hypothetical protein